MFPNRSQNAYIPHPIFLLSQPLLIYPPQTYFFNQKHLIPYCLPYTRQVSELNLNTLNRNNKPDLSNLLEDPRKQEIINFTNYEKTLSLTLPQKAVIMESQIPNGFLKPANQNINTNSNDTNKRRNNSNFISFDLSNIKILPPQEKLSLNELEGPKRKHKRWTVEEDNLLSELKKNQQLNWRLVASQFPTRTLKACQFRISRLKNIKRIKTTKKKT